MSILDLSPFKELIKQRCGLILEGNNQDKLADVLCLRLAASGCANPGEYLVRLYGSTSEFQELVNQLTINETYFFREAEQLHLLADTLVPRLLARRSAGSPLRILSAGCSSGEEPYSILMALREKYGESTSTLVKVIGGDIDTQVLAKARAGRYGEFSFRGVPAEIRARYFDCAMGTCQLKDSLRNQVEFHPLNLLADAFPPVLHDFDVIFLRNVSIYFDAPTRRVIQRNLASLLKDDGILVIGTAETLANDLGELALVEEHGLFYFAKPNHPYETRSAALRPGTAACPPTALAWPLPDLAVTFPAPQTTPAPLPEPFAPPIAAAPPDLDEARRLVDGKRLDEALELLERILSDHPFDASALLLKAHILLNRKDFTAAQAVAQQALDADPWSVDALMLLGLAAKWRDQPIDAVRWFKQAVYTRHDCWPARYYLAELYRNGGEADKARREYRGVQQSLSRPTDPGLKVVPLGMPAAEIRFLCEHQLSKLGESRSTVGK